MHFWQFVVCFAVTLNTVAMSSPGIYKDQDHQKRFTVYCWIKTDAISSPVKILSTQKITLYEDQDLRKIFVGLEIFSNFQGRADWACRMMLMSHRLVPADSVPPPSLSPHLVFCYSFSLPWSVVTTTVNMWQSNALMNPPFPSWASS